MSVFFRVLALLGVVTMFSTCAVSPVVPEPKAPRPDFDCLEATQPEFQKIVASEFASPDDVEKWISGTYDVSDEGVVSYLESEPMRAGLADIFEWQTDVQVFRMDALTHTPFALWVGWVDRPSVSQIIACLGKPAYYAADFRPAFELAGPIVLVKLFFPESGSVASFDVNLGSIDIPQETSAHPLDVNTDITRITRLWIGSSDTSIETLVSEYLDNVLAPGETPRNESTRQWLHAMLRPWPDDSSELVYETVPGP